MIYKEMTMVLHSITEAATARNDFFITLNGTSIRIVCIDCELPEAALISIGNLRIYHPQKPVSETFYILDRNSSELATIIPETMRIQTGRFIHSSEEGRIALSLEYGFLSLYLEASHETFIWLCSDKQSADNFISHPLHMELSWWALRHGWMFLHSAALGIGDKGVLLSGAGGSGKSTLALSGLMVGMDFLSDDYVLIEPSPVPRAIRIYDTGYLRDDMLKLLPELNGDTVWRCDYRDKTLTRLNHEQYRITDRLDIYAVIIPHISHSIEPYIIRNTDIRKLVPLLASTSYQNRELKNRDVFFGMMKLLKNIPAYDFYLTDDIRRNAEYLKGWVIDL